MARVLDHTTPRPKWRSGSTHKRYPGFMAERHGEAMLRMDLRMDGRDPRQLQQAQQTTCSDALTAVTAAMLAFVLMSGLAWQRQR